MKKTFAHMQLIIGMMLVGLAGATVAPVYASGLPSTNGIGAPTAPYSIHLDNGIIVTVDKYHHPPSKGVQLGSTHGPAVALLQTVPSVPGVTFQVGGRQFVSGADGTAAVMVPAAGTYDLQVITNTYHDPYRRVEFSRWLGESYQPSRQIHLPASETIQVGLNVYELVGEKFVGLDGKPVDPKRVTQFSIKSIQGDSFTFKDGTPRWIPASRVTRRRSGGLAQVPLLYTVTEAMVDGSNVVNKAQQQFYAQPNATWSISLLLYGLRISTQDALFGFPQGTAVQLYLPNGQVQTYPLDKNGVAQMYRLARGNYNFQIMGAKGLTTRAPIALSKDQELTTKVISFLDLAVIGGAGALLAIALVVFGRLSLHKTLAREEEAQRIRIYET